jgi:predicted TIM-barrel fold metal-dependent hydrolase
MFGSDYPLFPYETLFTAWKEENYPEDIMERIYYKNAIRILDLDLSEDEFK